MLLHIKIVANAVFSFLLELYYGPCDAWCIRCSWVITSLIKTEFFWVFVLRSTNLVKNNFLVFVAAWISRGCRLGLSYHHTFVLRISWVIARIVNRYEVCSSEQRLLCTFCSEGWIAKAHSASFTSTTQAYCCHS